MMWFSATGEHVETLLMKACSRMYMTVDMTTTWNLHLSHCRSVSVSLHLCRWAELERWHEKKLEQDTWNWETSCFLALISFFLFLIYLKLVSPFELTWSKSPKYYFVNVIFQICKSWFFFISNLDIYLTYFWMHNPVCYCSTYISTGGWGNNIWV